MVPVLLATPETTGYPNRYQFPRDGCHVSNLPGFHSRPHTVSLVREWPPWCCGELESGLICRRHWAVPEGWLHPRRYPALGYATQLWSPQTIDLIRRIERVQRRASKFILDLSILCEGNYRDRLLSMDILPISYLHEFWTWSFSLRPPIVMFVYHMTCSLNALFPQGSLEQALAMQNLSDQRNAALLLISTLFL